MSWVSIAVGSSAGLVTLTAIARWLRLAYKAVRTLIGIVRTMQDLVTVFQEHLHQHKQHDPRHETALSDLSSRLERLESEVHDLYGLVPHLRKQVPPQPLSHT